ncbi:NADH-quinone oxidoreductase subunit C [Microlunatus capsulatus]|uniref:NADH-quinone oxidoreductase subunit C n=1 Tax=Microlunatus capsulatus TaxID=99117 RepID=A0ABS4Z6Q0_9ACTN|nr:NADH-quinone oxidoreductase subunit C [Microlunatus capsulatus]MBP2416639.1 NADH-quinone oxidoreductase subunit C [Microlunatus capsulatus]
MSSVTVPAAGWREAVGAALSEGFTFFEWLGAVDEVGRADVLRVVVVLRHPDRPAETRRLGTEVPREGGRLDSLRDLVAGAGWPEREAAEMFGLTFDGGDPRRLLLGPDFEGAPLRKDAVLGARTALAWPGAKEPGESAASPSRRRMVPPGVPDPAVWGDRDPDAGPASPDEVAESAVGGRVRRRPGTARRGADR